MNTARRSSTAVSNAAFTRYVTALFLSRLLAVAWKIGRQGDTVRLYGCQSYLAARSGAGAAEPRRAGPCLERRVRNRRAGAAGRYSSPTRLVLHHATGTGLRAAGEAGRGGGGAGDGTPEGHGGAPADAEDVAAAEAGNGAVGVAEHMALAAYCAKDVEAEAAIAAVIPELQPDEQELSRLDAAMNTGGELGIDVHRVADLQLAARAAEKDRRGTLRGADRRGGDVAGDADGTAAGVARRAGAAICPIWRGPRSRKRCRRDGIAGSGRDRGAADPAADGPGLDPQAGADGRDG